MEGESSKGSIFELREEFMVSPTGGSPIFRAARFLRPTAATAIDGRSPKLPSLPFSSEAEWPLEVAFHGWMGPQISWKKWVDDMRAKYLPVWRSAGIDEAIMCSVYRIHRSDKLVLGLAERWCSETNTFVFAWGEATITLEDMMVLGGLSVLGVPVIFTIEEAEFKEIEQSLERSRNDMERLKLDTHAKWLKLFMGGGSDIEHEAFLSLWLSRFVFPGNESDKMDKHVFPVAVLLARGIRIALAPPVLASIYRDLSALRETMEMVASGLKKAEENGYEYDVYALTVGAPLQIVQLWAWERMIPLRPTPNCIDPGELRLARWINLNLKHLRGMNVRESIDSSAETFLWRPYVLAVDNWEIPKFYKESEQWVDDGAEELDEEVKSFMHCLRVCELVGIDCSEPYRPNRVAMQFGFDQDIPKWIPRSSNESAEVAWGEYSRPIGIVNIPPRLLESDVTVRYMEWWRKSVLLIPSDANKGILHGRRSSRHSSWKRTGNRNVIINERAAENSVSVPPGFPTKSKVSEGNEHTTKMHSANEKSSSCVDGVAGFHPEHYQVKVEHDPAFPNDNDNSAVALAAVDKNHESGVAEMELIKEEPRDCPSGSKIPGPDEIEARIIRLEKLFAWAKKQEG